MSFVRLGRSQQSQAKKSIRPKKTATHKTEWVSTVNDLSVHKLTPEELSHRHELHKSRNQAVAQWELKDKALRRRLRHPGSPAQLDQASLSIIREVFSDQLLLQDVLARSDRAMAVVKDLFGDAPYRQTGHPSVTKAPGCGSRSVLPVAERPDPPTLLSLLSQSTMDQKALNDLEASEEDYSDEGSSNANVVHRKNLRKMKVKTQRREAQQRPVRRPGHQGAGESTPTTPCTSGRAPEQGALNATVAVKRLRARKNHSQHLDESPSFGQSGKTSGLSSSSRQGRAEGVSESSGLDGSTLSSLSGNQSSLSMLQAMLGQVEAELDCMGPRESPPHPGPTQSLTGFSVALVSTLGRLARLLRQREEEVQREAEERRKLEEVVKNQRLLIDALSAETLALRDESAALQAGLQRQTDELEQRLATVVLSLADLGMLGDYQPQDSVIESILQRTNQDHDRPQAPISPAVLLSPPQQRDNRQHSPEVIPIGLSLELPIAATCCEGVQALSSAPSLTSLPLRNLPSTVSPSSQAPSSTSVCSQLSQDALLAQITQLTQQNELIRAQLGHAHDLWSSVRPSTNGNTDRVGSSSSGMGRATPQNVEARTGSANRRAERKGSSLSGMGRATPQNVEERTVLTNRRAERRGSSSSGTGRSSPQNAGERIGSTSRGAERGGSSSSGTWRATSQNVGEERISGPGGVGPGAQKVPAERDIGVAPAVGEELTQQDVAADDPSVGSIEQRLLELNRQSAAARNRLLELIEEQQRQSASSRLSPSASPIPTSAFSPHPSEEERTPGASMRLPAQNSSSLTDGVGRSSAGGEASLQSIGGQYSQGQAQADRLTEGEGWFALTTHVR